MYNYIHIPHLDGTRKRIDPGHSAKQRGGQGRHGASRMLPVIILNYQL